MQERFSRSIVISPARDKNGCEIMVDGRSKSMRFLHSRSSAMKDEMLVLLEFSFHFDACWRTLGYGKKRSSRCRIGYRSLRIGARLWRKRELLHKGCGRKQTD